MHNHKWSLSEIENLIPWERDVYIEMLNMEIENKNLEIENEKNK